MDSFHIISPLRYDADKMMAAGHHRPCTGSAVYARSIYGRMAAHTSVPLTISRAATGYHDDVPLQQHRSFRLHARGRRTVSQRYT